LIKLVGRSCETPLLGILRARDSLGNGIAVAQRTERSFKPRTRERDVRTAIQVEQGDLHRRSVTSG
jgi:hypothetical protein